MLLLCQALDGLKLREAEGSGTVAREATSTVIHNDKSVIRNTNHILRPAGVEIRNPDSEFKRERHWRIAERVITESGDVFVNSSAALATKPLRVFDESWVVVCH